MPALTESEARARAALLTVGSYDVSIDLTVTPVLSRTAIRFRCARPGAASFADLTASVRGGAAVLNGVPLGPPADGRLPLDGLAHENTLTVEAEIPDRGLTRFAEPSGGGDYVRAYAYPTAAPAAGRLATAPLATHVQPAGARSESVSGARRSSWSKQQKRSGAPVG